MVDMPKNQANQPYVYEEKAIFLTNDQKFKCVPLKLLGIIHTLSNV